MKINLEGVSETLLITLCAKAVESKTEDGIIKDYKSVEIFEKIDYDFSKFKKSKGSIVGTCIRTKIIDDLLKDIIRDGSDYTIINLGAGLDTRALRFLSGNIYWYDLDFENIIDLRKNFFEELEAYNNYNTVSSSILDYGWINKIKKIGKTIIICEGVLMYMEKNDIKDLIESLYDGFSKADFIFDVVPSFFVRNTNLHDAVKNTDAKFKWGIDYMPDIEKLSERIKLVASYNYADYYKKKWGIMRICKYLPVLKNVFNFNALHTKIL